MIGHGVHARLLSWTIRGLEGKLTLRKLARPASK